uniref:CoB--CoM heterodisulfide reductase iron-sulfur subunit A family protein n=1 Tax=uncultured Draconibacterium sp. TaxID=1573823 RepID=UPI0032180B18
MEEIKIGVYVCWCGTNIAKMVDVDQVVEQIQFLPDVLVARNYKYMCSDPGQNMIIRDIKQHHLNRVVVAACSPHIHELTFRKALAKAGLNPMMFQMANIREQVAWVHTDREKATKKAVSLVRAAINRVKWHESLERRTIEVNPATLVIGGGVAGMSAALEIANAGKQVYLVEKSDKLGGYAARLDLTFPYFYSARQLIKPMIQHVENHKNITVFMSNEVDEIFGYVGNFRSKLTPVAGEEIRLNYGNIIVATGLQTFDPSEIANYNYGKLDNVVTSLEFEKMLCKGKIETREGKVPENIAVIHCVGSRNANFHEYCSCTCCMTALKFENQIRSALPETNIFDLYADMRSFGKGCEELYTKTSRKDVMFLRFDPKNGLPEIRSTNGQNQASMLIEFEEQFSKEQVEVPANLIILMVAVEAHPDAKKIAHAAGISMCGNDFYIEKHPKLDPVATTTDGVYIVGSCQAPKNIPDSIAQAKAAAARILATIHVGTVDVDVITATVNEAICCGCQTCVSVCPYKAISFNKEKGVSEVNEILCKGCGTCGSTCPTGAIRSRHYTDQQILSQIRGLLSQPDELDKF